MVAKENIFIIEQAINQNVMFITGNPLRSTIPKDGKKGYPFIQPSRDNPLHVFTLSRNHTFLKDLGLDSIGCHTGSVLIDFIQRKTQASRIFMTRDSFATWSKEPTE